tara:strand:- start:552 stop:1469 length:918 start_codon:yes stop_codon:yes gene_type:complete
MTLDISGNLGIGIDPSTAAWANRQVVLDAGASTSAGYVMVNDNTGRTSSDGSVLTLSRSDLYLINRESAPIIFRTANVDRMTLDANGDLGLSAASGSRWMRNTSLSLAVNEQAGFQAQATRAGGSARTATMSVFKHSGITEAAGYLFLQPQNGVVYYYWTGDDGKFRVGQAAGNIGTNGGSVVGDQTSDETLKNIEVGFEYGIDEVMRMRPIAYSMKDDPTNKRMLGFGAQTTRPIIPELVYDTGDCLDGYDVDPENEMIQTPRSDRNKLAMEYIQAVPVLVNAMQQQQAMIGALTQRIESLEPA